MMHAETLSQKYSVNQHLTQTILSWVKAGEIAIPEIQRPFVWDATKVRDLIDSLYQGYPIGYIIAWKNPNIRLKDGRTSEGKKILIDGQQRVMALQASILGDYIIDKDYKRTKIIISFNPIEEKFEVHNNAIAKDNRWIQDISIVFAPKTKMSSLRKNYCSNNSEVDSDEFDDKIDKLRNIMHKQIGLIELSPHLDIETVTEVFIRINSKGVVLSQADFAMSKIAANETYDGSLMRKCIDYFCHLAVAPDFYNHIIDHDKSFSETDYFDKISWLKNENDDLYDPDYSDLLRVAFTSEFNRGKLSDLVSLLSGRNFETRTFEESIAEESFGILDRGLFNFISETNFKRFVMIIKSAGFISPELIRSKNALNFAYIIYLKLKAKGCNPALIEKYVRRWFVLSILTGRYSSSPESRFDKDIKEINERPFEDYLENVEKAELSDVYWDVALIQNLNTSVKSSPYFNVFLAAQVKNNEKGFLSKDITVNELISHRGDIHHLFPKNYLKKNGMNRGKYNQIANYVYTQQEINIKVGSKPPIDYFNLLEEQCRTKQLKFGGIDDWDELMDNIEANSIPKNIIYMDIDDYEVFLEERRTLMAQKIRNYYQSL